MDLAENVVLGGLTFGSLTSEEEVTAIMNRAWDLGIRRIDLGPTYGEGLARQLVARHLKSHPTQPWMIWEKLGLWVNLAGRGVTHLQLGYGNRQSLDEARNTSRSLFGDLGIDCYLLHVPPEPNEWEPLLETLQLIWADLEIGSVGLSNHEASEMTTSNSILGRAGFQVSNSQVHYNFAERRAESEFLPTARSLAVASVANRIFARGLLTRSSPKASARFKASQKLRRRAVGLGGHYRYMIARATRALGRPAPEIFLAWTLRPGGCDRVVLGISNQTQLDAVANLIREPIEVTALEEISALSSADMNLAMAQPRTLFDIGY